MVKIEDVKGEHLVEKFAEEMEEMLGRKMKSVKVTRAQAEYHQPWILDQRTSHPL